MRIPQKSIGWLSLFLILSAFGLTASRSSAAVGVSINIDIAPPALPVYEQPLCPGDGYIWTPGYWAYGPRGYYWIPGVWVLPPQAGLFWTPGYWECVGVTYVFHTGYWGPHVGFYGGVNYGFGYNGYGYYGGRWDGGRFVYDSRFNNVRGVRSVRTYVGPTVRQNADNRRLSYNGGRGGIQMKASEDQRRFAQQQHFKQTAQQRDNHQQAARTNGAWAAAGNHKANGANYRSPQTATAPQPSRPVVRQPQVARNPGPGDSYQRRQSSASKRSPQEFVNSHWQQQARPQQQQPRPQQQQPRQQSHANRH
ncbi:MAG: YXWGXW repeat-containing protein [Verrucomicrobiales bacterium]|jgi:hypothetical protein|nr:YXWGXW repeat-containing protein [Verrucomicrobiales bacterium]